MDDIARNLRAAACVLLGCDEHAPTKDGKALINLYKRADEMNAAADEIERLRLKCRWIPVADRLPELLTEVLGWHRDDRVRAWFRISGTVQGGPRQGEYWEMWSPQDRECEDCKVKAPTHWMPLPEPPEVK